MNFRNKLRAAVRRFMQGRTGIDQLGMALIYAVLILNILSLLPFLHFLSTLALLLLIFAVYRIVSKDTARRAKENQWFVGKSGPWFAKLRQALVRFGNRKQFVYFNCPECKAKLRLPRNVGEVTVTCGQCGHKFRKKA